MGPHRFRIWFCCALASIILLDGCAQASSASAGGTQPPAGGCRAQNPNANCYGGPP